MSNKDFEFNQIQLYIFCSSPISQMLWHVHTTVIEMKRNRYENELNMHGMET